MRIVGEKWSVNIKAGTEEDGDAEIIEEIIDWVIEFIEQELVHLA